MRGKTHLTVGCTSWITVCALAGSPRLIPLTLGTAVAGAGALLPDIDRGKVMRRLTGGHRHATHSLLGAAVAALAAVLVSDFTVVIWWLPVALVIGWLSHVAADSLTVRGCPWLWPWPRRFWLLPRSFRISTGGKRRKHPQPWQQCHGLPVGEWITSVLSAATMVACCWWKW
jgi:inner membrane protein